jgi:hypothetical protein
MMFGRGAMGFGRVLVMLRCLIVLVSSHWISPVNVCLNQWQLGDVLGGVPTLEFPLISGEQFCSDASGSRDALLQWCLGLDTQFGCCPCSLGLVDDKTVLPGSTKEILKMLPEFSTSRNGTSHYRQPFADLCNGEVLLTERFVNVHR